MSDIEIRWNVGLTKDSVYKQGVEIIIRNERETDCYGISNHQCHMVVDNFVANEKKGLMWIIIPMTVHTTI